MSRNALDHANRQRYGPCREMFTDHQTVLQIAGYVLALLSVVAVWSAVLWVWS